MIARLCQELAGRPRLGSPSSPSLIVCKNIRNCVTVHRRTSSGALELRIATMSPCARISTHSPPAQKVDLRQAEPGRRRCRVLVSDSITTATANDADPHQMRTQVA
jgi:hypothetical protein